MRAKMRSGLVIVNGWTARIIATSSLPKSAGIGTSLLNLMTSRPKVRNKECTAFLITDVAASLFVDAAFWGPETAASAPEGKMHFGTTIFARGNSCGGPQRVPQPESCI